MLSAGAAAQRRSGAAAPGDGGEAAHLSVSFLVDSSIVTFLPVLSQAQRQRVTAARRLWREALEVDERHLPSLLGLAALEARNGNHDRALT